MKKRTTIYEEVPLVPVPRDGTGTCATAFLNRSRDFTQTVFYDYILPKKGVGPVPARQLFFKGKKCVFFQKKSNVCVIIMYLKYMHVLTQRSKTTRRSALGTISNKHG